MIEIVALSWQHFMVLEFPLVPRLESIIYDVFKWREKTVLPIERIDTKELCETE